MWIDKTNVEKFIGKTVDATHRLFHHYPLTILKKPWGYCFRDCTGTIVRNDLKREPIYFDYVVQDQQPAEDGRDLRGDSHERNDN